MDKEERQFIEESMDLCKRAEERGVSLLIARYQDGNDLADVVLTNVKDAEQLRHLVKLRTKNESDYEDEE